MNIFSKPTCHFFPLYEYFSSTPKNKMKLNIFSNFKFKVLITNESTLTISQLFYTRQTHPVFLSSSFFTTGQPSKHTLSTIWRDRVSIQQHFFFNSLRNRFKHKLSLNINIRIFKFSRIKFFILGNFFILLYRFSVKLRI
jgi:hypothetical protein